MAEINLCVRFIKAYLSIIKALTSVSYLYHKEFRCLFLLAMNDLFVMIACDTQAQGCYKPFIIGIMTTVNYFLYHFFIIGRSLRSFNLIHFASRYRCVMHLYIKSPTIYSLYLDLTTQDQ